MEFTIKIDFEEAKEAVAKIVSFDTRLEIISCEVESDLDDIPVGFILKAKQRGIE